MGIVRNFALAATVAGALALGSAAIAQDTKNPEAKQQHDQHGKNRMRSGCHGEAAGKHDHS